MTAPIISKGKKLTCRSNKLTFTKGTDELYGEKFFRVVLSLFDISVSVHDSKGSQRALTQFQENKLKWKAVLKYLPKFAIEVALWIFLVCPMICKPSPFKAVQTRICRTNQKECCHAQTYRLKFHVGSERSNDKKELESAF